MKRGTASRLVKNKREARVVAIMRVEKASAEDRSWQTQLIANLT